MSEIRDFTLTETSAYCPEPTNGHQGERPEIKADISPLLVRRPWSQTYNCVTLGQLSNCGRRQW